MVIDGRPAWRTAGLNWQSVSADRRPVKRPEDRTMSAKQEPMKGEGKEESEQSGDET